MQNMVIGRVVERESDKPWVPGKQQVGVGFVVPHRLMDVIEPERRSDCREDQERNPVLSSESPNRPAGGVCSGRKRSDLGQERPHPGDPGDEWGRRADERRHDPNHANRGKDLSVDLLGIRICRAIARKLINVGTGSREVSASADQGDPDSRGDECKTDESVHWGCGTLVLTVGIRKDTILVATLCLTW